MKRLLALLSCLILLPTMASAITISHRYLIPNSTYSVEIPSGWHVMSLEMDEYEPPVYELGINHIEDMEFIKDSGFSMFVSYPGDSSLLMFVETKPYPNGTGISIESLTKEELDQLAVQMYKAYSSTNKSYLEVSEENAFSIEYENVKYVYWQNPSESKAGNTISMDEHFIIIEDDYMVDISFWHDTSDVYMYAENIDLVDFITKSVMKH